MNIFARSFCTKDNEEYYSTPGEIRVFAVFTHLREIYLTYIPCTSPKGGKKQTDAHRKTSDIIVKLKWHHHILWHLSVCRNFWEHILNIKIWYLMVSKKKSVLFVWGWNIKICPLGSPFVITRQASWCQTVILIVMSNSDPQDRFLYPIPIFMIDSSNPSTHFVCIAFSRLLRSFCSVSCLPLTSINTSLNSESLYNRR